MCLSSSKWGRRGKKINTKKMNSLIQRTSVVVVFEHKYLWDGPPILIFFLGTIIRLVRQEKARIKKVPLKWHPFLMISPSSRINIGLYNPIKKWYEILWKMWFSAPLTMWSVRLAEERDLVTVMVCIFYLDSGSIPYAEPTRSRGERRKVENRKGGN